jgi:hypothetical protein
VQNRVPIALACTFVPDGGLLVQASFPAHPPPFQSLSELNTIPRAITSTGTPVTF